MTKGIFYFLFLQDNDKRLRDFMRSEGITDRRNYLRYLYVIHRLLHYRAFAKDLYWSSGVPINMDKLEKKLSLKGSDAPKVIHNLTSWQMIEKIRSYKQGSHSRTYRLNIQLEQMPVTILPIDATEAIFVRNLIQNERKTIEDSWLLANQFRILKEHVTINDAGVNYLRSRYPENAIATLLAHHRGGLSLTKEEFKGVLQNVKVEPSDIGLLNILAGRIFVKRPDETSRIYTNLSSLKKEHRAFLHMGGKPLLMTDISNSQVLFSVPVIKEYIKADQLGSYLENIPGFWRYVENAQKGTFFEDLANRVHEKVGPIERSTLKELFWQQVFFGKIKAKGEVKRVFKHHYPGVAKIINRIKKADYAAFAVMLQRREANVIIDTVLTDLTSKGVMALTIHDSVIVTNRDDRRYVELLIWKTMKEEHGVTPKFKH
ncbi:MAG: hypothetical protein EOO46_08040 [Flavobacterium sp.]|nr:MAG: hypothetical protein EOO46_08040 [Flavobacterium sp.]